jgi:hypothetical protein
MNDEGRKKKPKEITCRILAIVIFKRAEREREKERE